MPVHTLSIPPHKPVNEFFFAIVNFGADVVAPKMRDWNQQDWKMRDQLTGVELMAQENVERNDYANPRVYTLLDFVVGLLLNVLCE